MTWKWSNVMMALAFCGALIFAGCADDNNGDGGGGGGGGNQNPLVGDWNAYEGLQDVGADELFYRFTADSHYTFRARYNAVISTETGTWRATADSIYFHETNVDGQPQDTTYAQWYDFIGTSDDSLRMRHLFDNLYEIRYVRAQ